MSTCRGCQALTLGHGFFVIAPKESKLVTSVETREGVGEMFVKFCAELYYTGEDVDIFSLPCCWPNHTGYVYFIGRCVVPFSWETKPVHAFREDTGLVHYYASDSEGEDNIPFEEPKWYSQFAELVSDFSGPLPKSSEDHSEWWRPLLEPPQCVEEDWTPILNKIYKTQISKTQNFYDSLLHEGKEEDCEDEGEETAAMRFMIGCISKDLTYTQPGWVFLPSDCASCT